MPSSSAQLSWCVVSLGQDMNWWVKEISDAIHWEVDGLGIVDPRQINHIIDFCDALRDYGFDQNTLDSAFFKFQIEREAPDGSVRLTRVKESLLQSEDMIFALPDIMDEEKGPYADFLDQITKTRVKLLNDLIDFDESFTIDELEEEIRERQNSAFMEGRNVHFFNEIAAILEYVPEGFEVEEDEAAVEGRSIDFFGDIPDLEETEERIEKDDTMNWEGEERENAEEPSEEKIDEEEDQVSDKPARRGRPRKE